MSRTLATSLSAVVLTVCGTTAVLAVPNTETESLTIELQNISPETAASVIRTLVGSRNIEIVGESGLKIRDSAENLTIAEDVIGMLEQPGAAGDKPIFRAVASNDTVIVSLRVENVPPGDLMKALREGARTRKVVVVSETSTLMVRDSQESVNAALDIVKELQSGAQE